MRATIWLASYPKSGNTWFRALLANLTAKEDQPRAINYLGGSEGMASHRFQFDNNLYIESGLLTHEESDRLRPRLYESLASGSGADCSTQRDNSLSTRFVKTHDGYTYTTSNEPLLAGARGAAAALLLVRDPRDVAISFAWHRQCGIDQVIDIINDPEFCFCGKRDRQVQQLRQQLCGWSGHAISWLDQKDLPVHVVRYEDMISDTRATLRAALTFAGISATNDDVARAVRFASFEEMRRQEIDAGFSEAPPNCPSFFRRGTTGGWQTELDQRQIARVEVANAVVMRRLGYLSAAAD